MGCDIFKNVFSNYGKEKKMKKMMVAMLSVVMIMSFAGAALALGSSKLIVKNSGGTSDVFKVTDLGEAVLGGTGGTAGTRDISMQNAAALDNFPTAAFYPITSGLNAAPAFQVIPKGTGFSAGIKAQLTVFNTDFVSDPANYEALVVRAGGANGFSINSFASGTGMTVRPINFQVGSSTKMTVASNGNVGIGTTAPASALHVNGTISYTGLSNVSSRTYKDNIEAVSAASAMKMVADLAPVSFTYLTDPDTKHMGFIAEDVPAQIATKDRKGVMVTEIIAVLTKVVQEQNKTIETLAAKVDMLEKSSVK
ncbi:MAG: hypothetical protein C0402_06480 [Thermodesulfovibrio sp.]|nr:hypothetical protein [Thermodesulfovibrio sp.]